MSKSNKEIVNKYNYIAEYIAKEPTSTEEATSLKKLVNNIFYFN